MRLFYFLFFSVSLMACSHGDCRNQQLKNSAEAKTLPLSADGTPLGGLSGGPATPADRIRVYKLDGSLQCNQGKAITPSEMQKELAPLEVYSSGNKHDGMMRTQVCGSPTGRSNVYEINRKDLEAAQKKGFKEWVAE